MARPPDQILDELLVLRCQGGDAEALEQLVSRWNGRLLRYAWRLTQDDEAARDAVQDAWIDMMRTIGRLRDPGAFRGWAYRIVGRKAVNWVRLNQRDRTARSRLIPREEISSQEQLDVSAIVRQAIRSLPA